MTDRLYYTDARLREFPARVVAIDPASRRVYLDRSAFYPTSGGQPHDVGTLGDARVTDVMDEDDRVAHVVDSLEGLEPGAEVTGTIDWTRRWDLMRQHTAQHLLSALCADRHGWPTTSVHFGDEYCTVDVAAPAIDPSTLASIEDDANATLADNLEVTVTFEDAATVTGLRKPSDRGGMLRIVGIDGVDRSACGGTHVTRTGEIGAILLRRAERMKGGTRVEFVAGARAVRRARADQDLLTRAARPLSASPEELPALVESQLASLRNAERELRATRTALAGHEASALWNAAAPGSDGVRRLRLPDHAGAARDMEPLAAALAALGGCVVLATGNLPPGVLLAASPDSGVDAGAALKGALATVGGRGGGSPRLAQGSVPDLGAMTTVASALGY